MKLMHISDLHLGKRLHACSLLEDQRLILDQIVSTAVKKNIDGLLIAGDIYDKSIPSEEAILLFDAFLKQLSMHRISVYLISGNHDSPERIAFGAEIMSGRRVYVSPVYDGTGRSVVMEDQYGPVTIWLLPFLKPAAVRHVFPDQEIGTYEEAVRTAVDHLDVDTGTRNVLVAHQFVTGAVRCESEEVSVGGLDQVGVSVFTPFDYVALGHIHGPQHVGRETVRYCGTPLKYSFSEVHDRKSVTIVEMREKGDVEIHTVELRPLRDMKELKGTYLQLTSRPFYETQDVNSYFHIILTDEEDVMDALGKLRMIYPNLMKLSYDNARIRTESRYDEIEAVERKRPEEVVEDFYLLVNGTELSEEQKKLTKEIMEEVWEGE